MRRVVYGCDWCGAEAPAGEAVSGDEEPIPTDWNFWEYDSADLLCIECRLASGEAMEGLRMARRRKP